MSNEPEEAVKELLWDVLDGYSHEDLGNILRTARNNPGVAVAADAKLGTVTVTYTGGVYTVETP